MLQGRTGIEIIGVWASTELVTDRSGRIGKCRGIGYLLGARMATIGKAPAAVMPVATLIAPVLCPSMSAANVGIAGTGLF
jgi:hypothetical protein